MVRKTGKLVIDSLVIGGVGSQLSSSLNVPAGSTMTSKFVEGTGKIVQPVLKVKGASMAIGNMGKLRKHSKKLLNSKGKSL